jgi:AraC-like DNA-binding protein
MSYWSFDVRALPSPDFIHRVWPDGCCSLVLARVNGRTVVQRIQGATLEPLDVVVHPGMEYRGIRFRPEMGAQWIGRPAVELVGCNLDALEVFGASLHPLSDAIATAPDDATVVTLFDAWIAMRCAADPAFSQADALVREAVDQIIACDGQCRIAALATTLGVQPRTLQRRFLAAVGLTPKAFAQLRRTRAILRRAVEEDLPQRIGWSGAAAEGGFADQSHLTREVHRRTQFSPTRLHQRLNDIDHERLVD